MAIAKAKKPSKPFASARIPMKLDEAITKHSKESGETRSEIIVNALNAYVGFPLKAVEGTPTYNRLDEIEKRLTALETKSKQAIQGNLLDNNTVINNEKENSGEVISAQPDIDNSIDNKLENAIEVPTAEAAKLTGFTHTGLNNRYKAGKLPSVINGYLVIAKLEPRKMPSGKKSVYWKLEKIDNKSDK